MEMIFSKDQRQYKGASKLLVLHTRLLSIALQPKHTITQSHFIVQRATLTLPLNIVPQLRVTIILLDSIALLQAPQLLLQQQARPTRPDSIAPLPRQSTI